MKPRPAGKINLNRYQSGSIGLMVFGLIFFVVGFSVIVFFSIPSLLDRLAMNGWIQVPAHVEHAELVTSRSSDSTTYRVVARFSYDYKGLQYTGNRVGLSSGSDNIGSWHEQTFRTLQSNPEVSLWINPDQPEESIYDRNIRMGLFAFTLLLGILFAGIGATVTGYGWYSRHRQKNMDNSAGILWEKLPEWRDNHILSSARSGMWVMWFFAIVWNLISWPVAFIIPGELAKNNVAVLVALLFPAVGLGLFYWAYRVTTQWRRFGKTPLTLNPFPGVVGGRIRGIIHVQMPARLDQNILVTLTCMKKERVRSGNKSETRKTVLWQDTRFVVPETVGYQEANIAFSFNSPDYLPATTDPADANGYIWEIVAEGETSKGSLNRQWTIPVAPSAAAPLTPAEKYQAPEFTETNALSDQPPLIPDTIVQVSETALETRFYYPMLRSKLMWIFFLTGALFFGLGVSPLLAEAGGLFRLIFSAIGGLFGLIGLYGLGNSLRVIANREGIETYRNVLGFRYARRVAVTDIRAFQYRITAQSSTPAGQKAFYSIYVATKDSRRIVLGDSLPGISAAQQTIRKILSALGDNYSLPIERTGK